MEPKFRKADASRGSPLLSMYEKVTACISHSKCLRTTMAQCTGRMRKSNDNFFGTCRHTFGSLVAASPNSTPISEICLSWPRSTTMCLEKKETWSHFHVEDTNVTMKGCVLVLPINVLVRVTVGKDPTPITVGARVYSVLRHCQYVGQSVGVVTFPSLNESGCLKKMSGINEYQPQYDHLQALRQRTKDKSANFLPP